LRAGKRKILAKKEKTMDARRFGTAFAMALGMLAAPAAAQESAWQVAQLDGQARHASGNCQAGALWQGDTLWLDAGSLRLRQLPDGPACTLAVPGPLLRQDLDAWAALAADSLAAPHARQLEAVWLQGQAVPLPPRKPGSVMASGPPPYLFLPDGGPQDMAFWPKLPLGWQLAGNPEAGREGIISPETYRMEASTLLGEVLFSLPGTAFRGHLADTLAHYGLPPLDTLLEAGRLGKRCVWMVSVYDDKGEELADTALKWEGPHDGAEALDGWPDGTSAVGQLALALQLAQGSYALPAYYYAQEAARQSGTPALADACRRVLAAIH
jgi:hypothetical protein